MFAANLHALLALGTALAVLALALVAALAPKRVARATRTPLAIALFLGAATAAVGLALLVLGDRPREWLHLLYAALALVVPPYAVLSPSPWLARRRVLWVVLAALLTLALVVRLDMTG